jgi:2-dehydro-3-deoxyphosphogluconate aldolase/(4S)-4-hydroxy-2-oxoglutarate aldolase
VIAVIRAQSAQEAKKIVGQCVRGGVKNIELTFTVPFAHRILEELSLEYGENILLGAGTVLDSETARIALLSGAQFIVSPCFSAAVVQLCNRYRVLSLAGIQTVTEAVSAMEAGADLLKLFPADCAGTSFLKALHGPLPQALLIPTGGITPENAGDWIRAGAVAVGAASQLTKGDPEANAAAYLAAVSAARKECGR